MASQTSFKVYEICGHLCAELNEDIANHVGRSYAQFLNAKKGGGYMHLSNEPLKQVSANGLMDAGCHVIDFGMTGTASRNPINFNCMRQMHRSAQPISDETGLKDIQGLAETDDFPALPNTASSPVKLASTLISTTCSVTSMLNSLLRGSSGTKLEQEL